mgnify:CR=1 FL=1
MVQVQVDIDKEENKIVRVVQALNDCDKKEAIRKIIKLYGKRMIEKINE